jgi:quinoprotein glucose dehydrogenase
LGQNLFANTLLCLDARTGKRVWHYQFVHHDLWDRDLPSPPNLLTVRRNGRAIPAVSQSTKSGHVFLFNRLTGEPLFPIEERAYPSSDLAGESAWPTQPLPSKPAPFARQVFSYEIINNLSSETLAELQNQFVRVRPHVPFTPPSEQGTVIFPGFDGAAEWGGQATSPDGVLYVNSNEMPWILTMINTASGSTNGERVFLQMCAACHGKDKIGTQIQGTLVPPLTRAKLGEKGLGLTEVKEKIQKGAGIMPSFGFLSEKDKTAVVNYLMVGTDAEEGNNAPSPTSEIVTYGHTGYNRWQDSNGYEELKELGIPPTGTENYGGPVVTAGGVLFIAASLDEHFRAFDMSTGLELFKTKLPAAGYATPATYSVDGKQFVVIACGGGKIGTKSGDAYVAFALPD